MLAIVISVSDVWEGAESFIVGVCVSFFYISCTFFILYSTSFLIHFPRLSGFPFHWIYYVHLKQQSIYMTQTYTLSRARTKLIIAIRLEGYVWGALQPP